MQKEFQERYEYARNRLKAKKFLYYHFVLFIVGSLFMFVANELLEYGMPTLWYKWAIVIWFFLFMLHFIRVYITKRFMNKAWENQQIEHLMQKQKLVEELIGPFCPIEPIIGMEEPYHYRNKVHAVFSHDKNGNPVCGVYEEGSHKVVPVEKCLIEDKKASAIILSI